jgi:large subunit ribosomal protein L13
MRTYVPRGCEAEELAEGKNWFVVDANGQVLGRLATRVARILIGKDKPSFTPNADCGDHVIVVNAEKIRLTGNKIDQKVYRRHSGYPGGLKEIPVRLMLQRRPEEVVREAVVGMLPKNKLRARRARKLRVYVGAEAVARHAGQKPQPLVL